MTSTATGEPVPATDVTAADPAGAGDGGRSRRLPRGSALGPRLAGAVVSGALVALSFPPYDLWPLAPVGVAALVLLTRGVRPRRGALLGLVHGLAVFLPLLSWLTVIGPDAWIGVALLESFLPRRDRGAAAGHPAAARLAGMGRRRLGRPGGRPRPAAVRRLPVGTTGVRQTAGRSPASPPSAARRWSRPSPPQRCAAGRRHRGHRRQAAPRPPDRVRTVALLAAAAVAVTLVGLLVPTGAGEARRSRRARPGQGPRRGDGLPRRRVQVLSTTSPPPKGSRPRSAPGAPRRPNWWCGRRTPRTSTPSLTDGPRPDRPRRRPSGCLSSSARWSTAQDPTRSATRGSSGTR